MADLSVNLSLTELPQYERLVTFAVEVEDLARVNADEELTGLVEELRSDLQEMYRKGKACE